mmetsp:Transcript_119440/g.382830  ORF Transcript_119440/g.382830 Transcript_119440/m.382830 type:complete len:224 (+) Transcript_119440:60-731(+)
MWRFCSVMQQLLDPVQLCLCQYCRRHHDVAQRRNRLRKHRRFSRAPVGAGIPALHRLHRVGIRHARHGLPGRRYWHAAGPCGDERVRRSGSPCLGNSVLGTSAAGLGCHRSEPLRAGRRCRRQLSTLRRQGRRLCRSQQFACRGREEDSSRLLLAGARLLHTVSCDCWPAAVATPEGHHVATVPDPFRHGCPPSVYRSGGLCARKQEYRELRRCWGVAIAARQ